MTATPKIDGNPAYTGAFRFFPLPTIARQRLYALLVLISQAAITVTGATVRVTGSGLGCETWPQCHEGSFVPVAGANPILHQVVEFGNRLLTFVLAAAAIVIVLAVYRAQRRTEIKVLSWIMIIGVIVQAVLGGITVLVGLHWTLVMAHFLPSSLLTFLAAILYVRVAEPDDGHDVKVFPQQLNLLIAASTALLAFVLVTGTLVTSAGPHAGDDTVTADQRLQVDIDAIARLHGISMWLFLISVAAIIAFLLRVELDKRAKTVAWALAVSIGVQAAIGYIQYFNGTPRALVPVHIAAAGVITALAGILFAYGVQRQGGTATQTGSVAADAELAGHTN